MLTETGKLAEDFARYFRIDFAHTEQLKEQSYGVRYRVYCEEFKYEAPEHFSNQQEKDEYDDISMHCLITHTSSEQPAGCVRLVPTEDPSSNFLLPLEKYCNDSLDKAFIESLKLDRNKECELSRLAVDQAFRRRPGEKDSRFGHLNSFDVSIKEQRTFPLIAVSAFVAAIVLTDLSGRNSVFAMMEPFLPRLLKRSGIQFVRAGQDVDYHGIRAAYFLGANAEY
ncbi:MAG: PEP-CTERM/exosortase system-associated acyltransferase, partial [Gammaproteobacteria bacterium]